MNFLKTMSPGQASLIGIILAIALYFLSFGGMESKDKALIALNAKKKTALSQIKKTDELIAEALKYQDKIDKLGGIINKVIKYIPKNMNSSKMMRSLTDSAKIAGVSILSVSEGRSSSRIKKGELVLYTKVPVQITLEGNFTQIMIFLSNLTKLENIITLEDFDIKSKSRANEGLVSFNGKFIGYKYVDEGKEKK